MVQIILYEFTKMLVISRERFFGPPPPSYQIYAWILYLGHVYIIDHVAAALGPLARHIRSARPRKYLNLT